MREVVWRAVCIRAVPATIGFGSAFPASQSVQNGQFCRRRCLFSGLLIVFGLLSGALAMAAGNFTMTIEHLDGDSTTFSIPSGAGQQTGPQTLVLKIPLPSKDGEIDKSVEASVIVRPVYSNGSSYVSQVLAGNFPTPTKLPQNGMRVFERKVKGIGTMVLYVFRVMTGCRSRSRTQEASITHTASTTTYRENTESNLPYRRRPVTIFALQTNRCCATLTT